MEAVSSGTAGGGISCHVYFWHCLHDADPAHRAVAGYDHGYVLLYSGGCYQGGGGRFSGGAAEQGTAGAIKTCRKCRNYKKCGVRYAADLDVVDFHL